MNAASMSMICVPFFAHCGKTELLEETVRRQGNLPADSKEVYDHIRHRSCTTPIAKDTSSARRATFTYRFWR